jgi:hypothetical protein
VKKHKLKIDLVSESDLFLVGISSTEPDYKLCWEINKTFFISLTKADDHVITNKAGEKVTFSKFMYIDESSFISYTLIRNKENNCFLLEDLKTIDYVFVVKGEFSGEEKQNFLSLLRKLPVITAAIEFSNEKLRYKERLFMNE